MSWRLRSLSVLAIGYLACWVGSVSAGELRRIAITEGDMTISFDARLMKQHHLLVLCDGAIAVPAEEPTLCSFRMEPGSAISVTSTGADVSLAEAILLHGGTVLLRGFDREYVIGPLTVSFDGDHEGTEQRLVVSDGYGPAFIPHNPGRL